MADGGKPRQWSHKLWEAYKAVGESDAQYIKSADRFMQSMLKHRLHETLELIQSLMHLFVIRGRVPNHEEYQSGIASIDLAEMREANLHDELDVYRLWWDKHIRWSQAKECICSQEQVELDLLYGLLSPKAGEHKRLWRTHPWFLAKCVQTAHRALGEDGFKLLEAYTPEGKHDLSQPIPEDQPLLITASVRMEAYVTSGAWRMDDAPLEDLKNSIGLAFNSTRGPLESRRNYFSRVRSELDDLLIFKMIHASEIALHPRIPLPKGHPIDSTNRHEEMLVLRLFGAERPEIADTMPDALLDEQGQPLKDPLRAVSDRTKLIARYLGFMPSTSTRTARPSHL